MSGEWYLIKSQQGSNQLVLNSESTEWTVSEEIAFILNVLKKHAVVEQFIGFPRTSWKLQNRTQQTMLITVRSWHGVSSKRRQGESCAITTEVCSIKFSRITASFQQRGSTCSNRGGYPSGTSDLRQRTIFRLPKASKNAATGSSRQRWFNFRWYLEGN